MPLFTWLRNLGSSKRSGRRKSKLLTSSSPAHAHAQQPPPAAVSAQPPPPPTPVPVVTTPSPPNDGDVQMVDATAPPASTPPACPTPPVSAPPCPTPSVSAPPTSPASLVSPTQAHDRNASLSIPVTSSTGPEWSRRSSLLTADSRSRSPSIQDNEMAPLSTHCATSLATVIVELAPIPSIGAVVDSLKSVFEAVEKSRVNREQWKLLQGRCVMVARIAGAQVVNRGGSQYPGLDHASRVLLDSLNHIAQRVMHWNRTHDVLAVLQCRDISEEIRGHFLTLDTCLSMFSYATDVAQNQWIKEFDLIQKQELMELQQIRSLVEGMGAQMITMTRGQDEMKDTLSSLGDQLRQLATDKFEIIRDQKNDGAFDADTIQIVQTIRRVTNMQLPPHILLGKHCRVDNPMPIRSGLTCDVFSASFLTSEKVAKKVFRVGLSDKDNVERYAARFLRDAQLWATFKCDYTLQFYGIGMESFGSDNHFKLYMVSPLMMNFDSMTYLKKRRNDPGMKEGIMRIITDAAKGLQYLHNRDPPVVHSGMRGENVLITDSGGGILGGFGLTKALTERAGVKKIPQSIMTGKSEGQRWMSPEMFVGDFPILQTPSDVWAWAMTALEIISGLVPYHHHNQPHSIILEVRAGGLPQRDRHPDYDKYALRPDELWALFQKCWAIDPADRPSIDEVLSELKEIAKN